MQNEFREIELVKKEIKEGRDDIAESIKIHFMMIPRPCGLAISLSMACLYGYYLIPKNWEDDLWYGKEATYDELGRMEEGEGFEIEYYWEY